MYGIKIFISTLGSGCNYPKIKTIQVSPFSLSLCAQHSNGSWHMT